VSHSALACAQLQSIAQPLAQSDIPVAGKRRSADGAVMFGSLLLALCQSFAICPFIVAVVALRLFDFW
jgi:hypothetical protein